MSVSRRNEAGVTIIEVLVALTIVGIAVAAVVGGMATAIVTSDMHRNQATADTVARSAAEHLKSTSVAYIDCAGRPGRPTYTVPSSTPSAVASVEFWDGANPAGFTSSCSTDRGLQRITLTVPGDGRTSDERLIILKRRR